MESVSLTTVFLQSQEKLRKSLTGLKLPKDYIDLQNIVNNHIEMLLVSDNDFRNSLNASDAEMLSSALRMALSFQKLSLTDSIDFKALSTRKEYKVEDSSASTKSDIIKDTLSLLPTVICAFIRPWLALVAGIGTVGVKRGICKQNNNATNSVKEFNTDISRNITEDEMNTILSGIESLCREIDGLISKIQRDRKDILSQTESKIDNCILEKMYPQLLTSLQYLIMENIKSETENQYVQNMIFSLQGYGYEIVQYSESTTGYFTKKINPGVTVATMYLPAIIREIEGTKIVAAPGIVFIPQK